MSDYISRDDLLNAFAKATENRFISPTTLYGIAKEFPAADVVERKRGEWVWSEEQDGAICSECKAHKGGRLTPFCPNCGATMETDFLHKR